jgi:CRISPR-associated endonuclease Csy4
MPARSEAMSHYLDIHLRTDPELATHHLLAALYLKLHQALVLLDNHEIAVSFPEYAVLPSSLGSCLRLIGAPVNLERLMTLNWLKGMRDHVSVGDMCEVPAHAEHRMLRRVQAKSSPERLRRRQMRRHGLDESQALALVPDSVAEMLNLPFVQLASASTGQTFRIYLRLGAPQALSSLGEFNTYGLSRSATTPWF